jgi:hypothetical protein
VCLLLLIASPFTAPFATYDMANGALHTGLDEGGESLASKIAGDTAVPVFFASAGATIDRLVEVLSDSASALAVGTGPSLFPLRL